MSQKSQFFANGKLLLTAEYTVLDGALALALPTTQFGQTLTVTYADTGGLLHWESLDETGAVWLYAAFDIQDNFNIVHTSSSTFAPADIAGLSRVLQAVRELQPLFLKDVMGVEITTRINYPRAWGLGSSATLVALVAEWAGVDAFALNDLTFKSSGYDVACANQKTPILFQKKPNNNIVRTLDFDLNCKADIYFVYLNKKQNSRDAIQYYRKISENIRQAYVTKIDFITKKIIADNITKTDFIYWLTQHEQAVSELLQTPTVQANLFADFEGVVKSLGAWGGDFVLAIAHENTTNTSAYFAAKGYDTVLRWADMF